MTGGVGGGIDPYSSSSASMTAADETVGFDVTDQLVVW